MKTAPRRFKKALGGNVDGDDDKAKKDAALKESARQLAIKNKAVVANPTYPSAQEQQGFNKSTIKKDIRTYTNTGGGTNAPIDISNAGGYTVKKDEYKKGGEVKKKMTKAPRRFKK